MRGKIASIGALLSAVLASACCIGPLIFAGLGLGSTGLAVVTPYRPIFLALTVGFLGLSFYFAYRRRSISCADGACEFRSASPRTKAILWIVAVIVLLVAALPRWL